MTSTLHGNTYPSISAIQNNSGEASQTNTPSLATSSGSGVPPPSSASLYVGELHSDVSEAMLYELFSQVGSISSIRICRDAITRRSLGYAYVNYHNTADCERAIDTLNYTIIKGQACRIMWSQRDPAVRRSGVGNIFIKNLDSSIDNKALHDTFNAFGNILSCKVALDDQSRSKGYGYVHYESHEAAQLAIDKVNGMLLNGKKVFVGHHIPRKARTSVYEEAIARYTNVYVKNLDSSSTEGDLMELFKPFGEIQSAFIQKNTENVSRGFGFINFVNHDSAMAAVEGLNNIEFHGKQLFVGRAQKRGERLDELRRQFEAVRLDRQSKYHGVNLYVKNLDEQVDEERIRMEFTPFGVITSAKIMVDENGRSKGFGFVCFSTPEEAGRAISGMNGKLIFGKPVYVALAQRKEERRAQLELQFAQRAQQLRYQQQMAGYGMGIFQQGPLFYPGSSSQGGSGNPNATSTPNGNSASLTQTQMSQMTSARPGIPNFPINRANPSFSSTMLHPSFSHASPSPMMMRPARPFRGPYRPPMAGPRPGMEQASQSSPSYQGQMFNNNGTNRRPPFPARFGPNVRNASGYGSNMMYHAPTTALTAASLAAASPEEQKRMIGERLFPLVQSRDSQFARKITGMLLEMDNTELLHLLETPEALNMKVAEAQEVLRQHFQLADINASSSNGSGRQQQQ